MCATAKKKWRKSVLNAGKRHQRDCFNEVCVEMQNCFMEGWRLICDMEHASAGRLGNKTRNNPYFRSHFRLTIVAMDGGCPLVDEDGFQVVHRLSGCRIIR